MTTKFEDDTTGEQYTRKEIKQEGIIGGDIDLWEAGVVLGDGMYSSFDYHPEHADYDELRRMLHEMVDDAVDAFEEVPDDA